MHTFAALACTAGCLLAGCTTVHIHSDAGVHSRSSFGIAYISLPDDATSLMTQVSGLGVVMGASRLTFGWMSEASVALRDASRCQVVFMSATQADALAIQRLLAASGATVDHICVLTKGEAS